MQDNLLKTNFLGRDGFRWWIGQIPPIEVQESQANGGGWGNRHKVRIMGYHPFDANELPDNDLPWAQCLLPTTSGTGAANNVSTIKLQPGDVVFGFFLDSDNAQTPIIMGAFGRTSQVLTTKNAGPFQPFTGYTGRVKKPNGTLAPNESNEQNTNSAKSPSSIDNKTATQLNGVKAAGNTDPNVEISYNSVIGSKTTFANTCDDTAINGIINEVTNLLDKIQNGAAIFSDITGEIRRSVDTIVGIANGFVGQMFNTLFKKLTDLLKQGLDLLYKTVFAQTLASTAGNVIAAHAAGVAAQTSMIAPVGILEQAIPCVAANVVKGLTGVITELLNSVIGNVQNFVTCAGQQFAGAFLNTIIDSIVSGLSSALGGVSKILSSAFNVADFLRSTVDSIKALSGLFDCNQDSKSKCSTLVREWTVGKGPKNSGPDPFAAILSGMNVAAQVGNAGNSFEQKYGTWDIFGAGTKTPNLNTASSGCYTGPPTSCSPPTVNIFGGGGSGATAVPLLGSFVDYAAGNPNAANSTIRTASIIGVDVTNGGSGYRYPPYVEFVDNCNQGYGAIGRALINDAGEVTSIYIVSAGEFYPVGEVVPYGVVSAVITLPGKGYLPTDTATDSAGIKYNLTVSNGQIINAKPINSPVIDTLPTITINSDTGVGAIIRPILGVISPKPPGSVIDSNQCYIK